MTSADTCGNSSKPPLYHVVDGRDGAPWLIFSNSLATDLTLWNDQVRALSQEWKILRYDFRGHGRSERSCTRSHNLNMLAGDLLSVMDDVGIVNACHVGVSMGALAGIAAAAAAPERFCALVCCNARLRSTKQGEADLAGRAQRALRQGMAALVEPTLEKWFGTAQRPLGQDKRIRIAGMIAETSATDFAAYADGMRNYDLEAIAGKLPFPILLLAGSDDGAIPADFRKLSGRYQTLSYAEIDGAGHLPNIQAPDEFNARLLRFTRDLH